MATKSILDIADPMVEGLLRILDVKQRDGQYIVLPNDEVKLKLLIDNNFRAYSFERRLVWRVFNKKVETNKAGLGPLPVAEALRLIKSGELAVLDFNKALDNN